MGQETTLVSRCFESGQTQKIISGLKTNFSLSPNYLLVIHFTSHYTTSLFFSNDNCLPNIFFKETSTTYVIFHRKHQSLSERKLYPSYFALILFYVYVTESCGKQKSEKTDFLAAGEACKAIFWPIGRGREGTFDFGGCFPQLTALIWHSTLVEGSELFCRDTARQPLQQAG